LIKGHKDYVEKVKNEIVNIIIDLVSCNTYCFIVNLLINNRVTQRRSSGAVGATHRGLCDLGPSIQKKTDMNKRRSLR
jgi:hypothetical protein